MLFLPTSTVWRAYSSIGAAERLQVVSDQTCIYIWCVFLTWRADLIAYVDKTIIIFPIFWLLNTSNTCPWKPFTFRAMIWQWNKIWAVNICVFHPLTVEKGLYLVICTLGHLCAHLPLCLPTVMVNCSSQTRLPAWSSEEPTCLHVIFQEGETIMIPPRGLFQESGFSLISNKYTLVQK